MSPGPPVPGTYAGRAPCASAQWWMNSWSIVMFDMLTAPVAVARARLVRRAVPTRRALVPRRPLLLLRAEAARLPPFARDVARPRAPPPRAVALRPRLVRLLLLRVPLVLLGTQPPCLVWYFNHGWS